MRTGHLSRVKSLISVFGLTLALTAIIFATYRHWLTFRVLFPSLQLSPQRLQLPLSRSELSNRRMRWVEVSVTPAPNLSGHPSKFHDSVESPGTLILQLDHDSEAKSSYRGILYTTVNRSRPGVPPEPLIRELSAGGISSGARFAVLRVGASPWLIWSSVLRELGVLVSGLVILVALILHLRSAVRRAVFDPDPRSARAASLGLLRSLAGGALAFAAIWAIYRSTPLRPVLPVESIWALGIGAALVTRVKQIGETQ